MLFNCKKAVVVAKGNEFQVKVENNGKKFDQSQVNDFLKGLLENAKIEQIEHFVKNHRAGVKASKTRKSLSSVAV